MKHFYYQLPMMFVFLSLAYMTLLLLLLGHQPQQHDHFVSGLPISLPKDSLQVHLRSKGDDDEDADGEKDVSKETTDSGESAKKHHKDKDFKDSDDDSGSKYDVKWIIFTGVMVASVLFMAFFCFLGICNLQCCCGALGGAVSGAKIGNQQREQKMKQQQTSGSKTKKRGHTSSKSYPIVIETDSSGGSSSSRKNRRKNRTMVVTVDRGFSAEAVVDNEHEEMPKKDGEDLSKAKMKKLSTSFADKDSVHSDSFTHLALDGTESESIDVSTSQADATSSSYYSSSDSTFLGESDSSTGATTSDSGSLSESSASLAAWVDAIDKLIAELGTNCTPTSKASVLTTTEQGKSSNEECLEETSPSPPITPSSTPKEAFEASDKPMPPAVKAQALPLSQLINRLLMLYEQSKTSTASDGANSPSSSSPSPPTVLPPSLRASDNEALVSTADS